MSWDSAVNHARDPTGASRGALLNLALTGRAAVLCRIWLLQVKRASRAGAGPPSLPPPCGGLRPLPVGASGAVVGRAFSTIRSRGCRGPAVHLRADDADLVCVGRPVAGTTRAMGRAGP
jgi:hypothetical protein